jgi:hypothetical protein
MNKMDAYRQITQGVAAGLDNSFGNYMVNFRKLDPQKFNQMQHQEQTRQRVALAEQVHTIRQAATARNADRVAAKRVSVRTTHNERVKKKIQAQVESPQFEKRKPGRPKKLPPVASEPPARKANPSPS